MKVSMAAMGGVLPLGKLVWRFMVTSSTATCVARVVYVCFVGRLLVGLCLSQSFLVWCRRGW